jgi:hypothetical protein
MARDAKANPTNRYVFILHEYNRVPDFLSIFGNFFESELRHSGPDAWKREREPQSIHQSSTAVASEILGNHSQDSGSFLHLPENVKLILTGNPAQNEEFMGETTDFLRDPALSNNRLVGAKVDLGDFSLEKEEKFPCNVIEKNLLGYVERTVGANAKQRVEEHWAKLDNETGVNAGKKVALAWQLLLDNENPNEGGSGDIQTEGEGGSNKYRWDFARNYQELIKELVRRCMEDERTEKPEQRPREEDFPGETCELERLKLFRKVSNQKFPVRIVVWGTSKDSGLHSLLSPGMTIRFPLERRSRKWSIAENYFGDVWPALRRFLGVPVAPSGSGAVAPSGSGAVAPSGSGAVAPSGSGAVAPSGSGAVAPSGSGAVAPSGSGAVAPSGSGAVAPSGSGAVAPSGSGAVAPSGSGAVAPSGSGAVAPSGSGAVAPSGSGAVAPSGSGAVAPSGSGAVAGPSWEQGSKKRKM